MIPGGKKLLWGEIVKGKKAAVISNKSLNNVLLLALWKQKPHVRASKHST
jgi:hypothetical protein